MGKSSSELAIGPKRVVITVVPKATLPLPRNDSLNSSKYQLFWAKRTMTGPRGEALSPIRALKCHRYEPL